MTVHHFLDSAVNGSHIPELMFGITVQHMKNFRMLFTKTYLQMENPGSKVIVEV